MSFLTNHEALVFCHFLCGSEENLRAAFCKLGVGNHALEDVVDKAPNRHYQVIQLPAVFRFALRCFCFFIFLNIKVFLLIVNMATCAVGMRLSILICPWPVLWCRYVMNHPNQYLSDSQKILHSKVYPAPARWNSYNSCGDFSFKVQLNRGQFQLWPLGVPKKAMQWSTNVFKAISPPYPLSWHSPHPHPLPPPPGCKGWVLARPPAT